ncbi:MAG TPA: cyclic nucleotide-binding domain-containing protein [Gaiellaceae bacterium]|nr:cyclic nucleotide-binding domain-containing protein [Gaiellaceae bacterium]
MDVKQLEEMRLFSGVSRAELDRVAKSAIEVDVPEGFYLVRQGHVAYEFFVIQRGTADVIKDGEKIAELGPGDFFGEIGMMETERRTADVVATSHLFLVVMHERDFAHIEEELPTVSDRIRSAVRARLDHSS